MLQIESWVSAVRATDLDHEELSDLDPEHGIIRFGGPANRYRRLKAQGMIGCARKGGPERKEGT